MFKVGIIGAGNMGEAILKGIVEKTDIKPEEIIISDINSERLNFLVQKYGVAATEDNRRLVKMSDLIFLSVKPKDLEKTLSPLKEYFTENKIVISVLAGIKIEKIKKLIEKSPVVRIMPNTPALIGEGAIGVSFDDLIKENEKNYVLSILKSLGLVLEFQEDLMDAVTGLSGSGPAYVFNFIDSLAQGGVKVGLSYNDALKLAVQTVIGAAKMVKELEEHPSVLRDKVTSPAGTTIYGLHALEKGNFKNTVMNAVEEATKRSKELSD